MTGRTRAPSSSGPELKKILDQLGDSPLAEKLRRMAERTSGGGSRALGTPGGEARAVASPTKADKVLQLKVNLAGAEPPIWRRLLVRDDTTLDELHLAIQISFGWANAHMYEFRLGKKVFQGEPDGLLAVDAMWSGGGAEPTAGVLLNTLKLTPKSRLQYTYDLGDQWEHTIQIEKPLITEQAEKFLVEMPGTAWKRFASTTRTPVAACIGGERAGPFEDCGGWHGYMELCQVLGDPKHPEHRDMMDWARHGASNCLGNKPFDPDRLEVAEVNSYLKKFLKR
jgi:hypothetical protein